MCIRIQLFFFTFCSPQHCRRRLSFKIIIIFRDVALYSTSVPKFNALKMIYTIRECCICVLVCVPVALCIMLCARQKKQQMTISIEKGN